MALKYKRVGATRTLTGMPGGSFGLERADSTTLFSLGSFRVTTNLRPAPLPEPGYQPVPLGTVVTGVTLADLQLESLEQARAAARFQRQLRLPQDPAHLAGYASFGSLRLRLRAAARAALQFFPAGLVAQPVRPDGARVSTVVAHSYSERTGQTTLALATDRLLNPFALNLHELAQERRPGQADLLRAPDQYVLDFDGTEYPLVAVTGLSQAQTAVLTLTVQGAPFAGASAQSLGAYLVVRPGAAPARAQFRTQVPELSLYLLGGAGAPLPGGAPVVFRLPVEGEAFEPGEALVDEITLDWPRPDGYHIAQDGVSYDSYLGQLENLGDALDGYKSDLLVSRFAPPDSLLALDRTEGGKIPALLRVWGRQLDDTKLFIDALVRVNHLDYDPARGLPEQLVHNLAATLGWQVRPLLDEDQLLNRLYSPGLATPTGAAPSVLPADLDAELWRRIALNTHWFMRAKGTRAALESMLNLLGIPGHLLRFDEHAYLLTPQGGAAASPEDERTQNVGYGEVPDLPPADARFQNTKVTGNYLAQFQGQGLLQRLTDNRKVWVAPSDEERAAGYQHQDQRRQTSYQVPAGAHVVPSKEISLSISPARAWDYGFYDYVRTHGWPGAALGADPLTLRVRGELAAPAESLAEFIQRTFERFVDARSHKTAGGYPTLRGLVQAYRREAGGDVPSLRQLLAYTGRLNRYWKQLASQLLPATTILRQQATTVSNPGLATSKHRYRRGISAGSEFRQPVKTPPRADVGLVEFQGDAYEPLDATVYGIELGGSVRSGRDAVLSPFRRPKLHMRTSVKEFPVRFPAAEVFVTEKLVDEIDVAEKVIYVYGVDVAGKPLTIQAPADMVLPHPDGRAPEFECGYAVYEGRAGQPLSLIQREWLTWNDFQRFVYLPPSGDPTPPDPTGDPTPPDGGGYTPAVMNLVQGVALGTGFDTLGQACEINPTGDVYSQDGRLTLNRPLYLDQFGHVLPDGFYAFTKDGGKVLCLRVYSGVVTANDYLCSIDGGGGTTGGGGTGPAPGDGPGTGGGGEPTPPSIPTEGPVGGLAAPQGLTAETPPPTDTTGTGTDGTSGGGGGGSIPDPAPTDPNPTDPTPTPTEPVETNIATARRLVPSAALRSDREYVVKTFFRKRIHRGSAPVIPSTPWDNGENFRFNFYHVVYRDHPKFVDPFRNGYDLELSNEMLYELPGSYFNSYRASTDSYFPTLTLPDAPLLDTGETTGPVVVYEERLINPSGGTLIDLVLTYRALEPPQFLLNGRVLSEADYDYQALYPEGHVLAWQHYRLLLVPSPASTLVARYRTAQQQLRLVNEDFSLLNSQVRYIDVENGQVPPQGVRMFLCGGANSADPAPAIGFVLNQPALRDSATATLNGTPVATPLSENLELASGATLRLPGVLFMLSGGVEPSASDNYRLSYGALDSAQPDVLAPSMTEWTLRWSCQDRYAPDLLGGRVRHTFLVEATNYGDYFFTSGNVVTLATRTLTTTNASRLEATINLTTAAGGAMAGGGTYLVRVRAHKEVSLVNGTVLIRDASSVIYRFETPGDSQGLIDFSDPEFIIPDFY